jgi:hypothetical protein
MTESVAIFLISNRPRFYKSGPGAVDNSSLAFMPHSFELSVESPVSVVQVRSAFGEKDYWLARLDSYGAGAGTLESLVIDADGTVAVTTTVSLLGDGLPGLVTQLTGGALTVTLTEMWRPIDGGRMRGEVSVTVRGVPLSGFGAGLLTPAGSGSRLDYTATVEANVPVFGGTIESYIGAQLAEPITEIQRFTTVWISEHA